jgi:multiple sugar transport system substrate-binding protein
MSPPALPPIGARRVSRRSLLRAGATGAGFLAVPGLLSACGRSDREPVPPLSPGQDPWRRFSGTTINFISENTAPTAAIAANLAPFTELTGITVRIVTLELSALVQRVALDMASGTAQYQVIYADPYQVLAPYSAGLADLREFIEDDSYPELEGGLEDFIPTQLQAAGRFQDEGPVYALPYDCPTMIWQYRADLFDAYGARMADELGFDPTPGSDRTWDEYLRIASWFTDNVDEVRYGTGHQAKQHDSLMCDFSNVLWAYGGEYFEGGEQVGLLGVRDPGSCTLGSAEAVRAAAFTTTCCASRTPHPARGTGTAWGPHCAPARSRCAPTGTSSPPATRRTCRARWGTHRCRRARRARRTCTAAPGSGSPPTRRGPSGERHGCSSTGRRRRRRS